MLRPPQRRGMRRVPAPARSPRAACLGVAALLALVSAGGAQDQAAAPAAPEPAKPAEYIGSDVCASCHEDISKAFAKNPHYVVETDKKRGFATRACEACHGPASKHVDSMSAADVRNPPKMKLAEADRMCLGCHLNQRTHSGRINASHARNNMSCVACHFVHKNGPNGLVSRKPADINSHCASCHADVWATYQRPYRHRLPEGAMTCVDCHNPHGNSTVRTVDSSLGNEPGCVKCHGDLRGPFTFEHPPMRLEGCTACHLPHGSANPRMLTRAEVRLVCLECHSNLASTTPPANGTLGTAPPGFHNLNDARFRNCNVCHQKVHGSYASRDFLK